MSIRKVWKLTLLLVLLIVLAFSAVGASADSPSDEDSGWKNYIVVVDNSGSNVAPTRALGAATDPNGLRFSACRLLYNQMLPENNRIGLIVFSGSGEYCSSFGPIERSSLAAETVIYDQLKNPAVTGYRNVYTDINYALNEALKMANSFHEGNTAVILLTDGVNDLTNSATALTDQANLDANEKTVDTVRRVVDHGHSFYIIALTAEGNTDFRSTFMTFINRLGEAGGGVWENDGSMSNVYEAQANTLDSVAIEILGKQNGQIINEKENLYTPITDSFEIPDIGVSEAGITISFAVNDKSKLRAIYLSDPNGNNYLIWENGRLIDNDNSLFTVQEDINYFNIRIVDPVAGNWFITVEGEEGTNIKRMVKLDQNVRLKMDIGSQPNNVDPMPFRVVFQEYKDNGFVDIIGSDLYSISEATLTLTAPSGEVQTHTMTNGNSSFDAELHLQEPGYWTANVEVKNEYLEKKISNYAFQVEQAIIPTMPPVGDIQLSLIPIIDTEGSVNYIDRSAETVEISWACDNGNAQTTFQVIEDGKLVPLRDGENINYCIIGADELKVGSVYTITVNASNSDNSSTASSSMIFALYPDPSELTGFEISCSNQYKNEMLGNAILTQGNSAAIKWSVESGEVASLRAEILDEQGNITEQIIKDPSQKTFYVPLKEGEETVVRVIPVPKYGDEADGKQYTAMLIVSPKVLTFSEKLQNALPTIITLLVIVLIIVGVVILIRELTSVRLKGTLAVKCSTTNGYESMPIYIPLDGMKNGSMLAKKKNIKRIVDDAVPNAPFFTTLCKIRLYKERTDEMGHIPAGLTEKTFMPDNAALKVVLGADVLEFIDSNNERCSFIADGDDGETYRFVCAYSDDNPFPIV